MSTGRIPSDGSASDQRVELLLAGQKRALELAVNGSPLPAVLEALARTIEAHFDGRLLASILLVDPDGRHLRYGAAPSLPNEYREAIDGIEIGPSIDSCGAADSSGQAVLVTDTAGDPLWTDFRRIALEQGLKACWSTPIRASSGRVLATFTIYYREPCQPSAREREVVELLAHTAAIILERVRAEEKLRTIAARYRLVGEAANDAIWDWDLVAHEVTWSPGLQTKYGFAPELVRRDERWWVDHIHPDDRERVTDNIRHVVEGASEIWTEEYRFRRFDGSYASVVDRGRVVRDADGQPVRMVGAMLDLTERKRAEARDRLLVQLDDAVRSLTDPGQIAAEARRMLEEHLDVTRCVYVDVDRRGGARAGTDAHAAGADRIAGLGAIEQLGAECATRLQAGERFVLEDCREDRRITTDEQSRYELLSIRGVICVPVLHGGRCVAAVTVPSYVPRAWRVDEVEITQEVANRCWGSIERARLTRHLRQSELRFRELANTIANLAWMARPDGAIYWFNDQWFAYTGTTLEQMEGWGWQRVHDPDVLPLVMERWQASIDNGLPFEMVFPIRGADGQFRRFLTRVNPVRDSSGTLLQWVGTNTDVEDERRATEANALLRAVVEFANDSILITDAVLDAPGPRIEYVNRAFTTLTGYEATEIIGRTPRLLQGEETDREVLGRLREDLAAHEAFHGETVNYRKDGSKYIVEWRITPLKDQAGRVLKWVSVQRDVTERRAAEARREDILEAERAARTEAERVGRMKDEFLATLSHELRTPLNAILGWAQILALGKPDTKSVQEGAAVISRNARVQAQMIEDLLDMSRIISGKVRLDVRRVDVADVVAAAIETVQPSADAKKVRLVSVLDPGAGPVSGDAGRLQQAVWNLLSNAVKFTPAGGHVQVVLQRVDSHLELSVHDTGQGIASNFLPHVFERFRQADASTTRQFSGLGLGLSIVKQLVELHGGSVRANSPGEGEGSTFVIALPLAPVDQQGPAAIRREYELVAGVPAERDVTTTQVSLNGLRILVVDDDSDSRELITRVLRDCGAAVKGADSARAALHTLGLEAFDLLVSDIGMPESDGYDLIRRVRASAEHGRIPSIALTAFARSEDRRRALLAGYDMHVAKPVEPVELLTVCSAVVARRDTRM